jgi:hypothetical protein
VLIYAALYQAEPPLRRAGRIRTGDLGVPDERTPAFGPEKAAATSFDETVDREKM